FGALLVIAASFPAFGRVLTAILGAASLAFGVIVLADGWTHRIDRWTAANDTTGWVAVVTGAVLLLAALLLPNVHRERTPRPAAAGAAGATTAVREDAAADDVGTRDETTADSPATDPSVRRQDRRRHWWQPVHGHRAGA